MKRLTLESFLPYLSTYKQLRPNSLRLVRSRAKILIRELPEWSQEAVERFLADKKAQGSKETSIHSYSLVWNYYIEFLNHYNISHTFKKIPMKHTEQREIGDVLTPEEMDRLLNVHIEYCPIHNMNIDNLDLTYNTFIELQYHCGLRFSDASDLRVSDCQLPDMLRITRTKSLQRPAYLTPSLAEKIEKLIKGKSPQDYIFKSSYGNKLNIVTFSQDLKKRVKLAGITKHVSTHTFRRSFATTIKRQRGGDLGDIARALGDKDLQTVHDHYLKYEDEDMKKTVNKLPGRLRQLDPQKIMEEEIEIIKGLVMMNDGRFFNRIDKTNNTLHIDIVIK